MKLPKNYSIVKKTYESGRERFHTEKFVNGKWEPIKFPWTKGGVNYETDCFDSYEEAVSMIISYFKLFEDTVIKEERLQ